MSADSHERQASFGEFGARLARGSIPFPAPFLLWLIPMLLAGVMREHVHRDVYFRVLALQWLNPYLVFFPNI